MALLNLVSVMLSTLLCRWVDDAVLVVALDSNDEGELVLLQIGVFEAQKLSMLFGSLLSSEKK